jgi:hypothetical protein
MIVCIVCVFNSLDRGRIRRRALSKRARRGFLLEFASRQSGRCGRRTTLVRCAAGQFKGALGLAGGVGRCNMA